MKDILAGVGMALGLVAGVIVFITLLVALVFATLTPFMKYDCDTYGKITGRQVKYNIPASECYVQTPNGWFTKHQINQNNVSKQ